MSKTYQLDCKGMVCPMPVAKTKRKLNEMESGDILEITGDFCEAGENIIRFVENNSGKVLESKFEGPNFHIKIKKL